MDVRELRQRRATLESQIADELDRMISRFHENTQVPITSVDIDLLDVRTLSETVPQCVVIKVKVGLDI